MIELAKKVRSLDDSSFRGYADNSSLFFEKYTQLGEQWVGYCEKRKFRTSDRPKEWRNMLREMRLWKEQELDWMYMRIMNLARNFAGSKYSYFEVKTYSGSSTVPDKSVILNRLMLLYNELLDYIYPSVIRLLSYTVKDIEIETPGPRGTILLQKTITNAIKNSGGIPTTFICSIPDRSFNTPENRLLLIAIKSIHNDALQVYQYQKRESVDIEDKRKVWKIINVTQNILDSTPLHEIRETTKELKLSSIPKNKLKQLLNNVGKDLEKRRVRQAEYTKLLQWIRKYIDFNANRYEDALRFTLENNKDLDTMFELWCLFEFVNYIKLNFPGVKIKPEGDYDRKKKSLKLEWFEITYSDQTFKIRYTTKLKAQLGKEIEHPTLEPDYTIEYDGNHAIILDAKNWRAGATNRMEAVHKMNWYLSNFYKEYKSETGILFFPSYEKNDDLDENGVHTGQFTPKIKDAFLPLTEDIEFRFINFVLKATRDPQYKPQIDDVFAEICGLIPALP